MKILKTLLALGLVALFFVGCSKDTSNTNTSTTSTGNSNTKASSTPATPATTPNSSSSSGNSSSSSSSESSSADNTFRHQEAGIQFTLPAGWKSKPEGETITAASADDAINVVFWVPKGDDFNKAVDDLSEQLDKVIKNSKVTSPGQESTHNGMRAYTAAGSGEVDNKTIVWEVDVLQAKKPFFVLTFAAPEQFKSHEGEYQQLLGSLKKME
jgi:predicted Zn-dependent protease